MNLVMNSRERTEQTSSCSCTLEGMSGNAGARSKKPQKRLCVYWLPSQSLPKMRHEMHHTLTCAFIAALAAEVTTAAASPAFTGSASTSVNKKFITAKRKNRKPPH